MDMKRCDRSECVDRKLGCLEEPEDVNGGVEPAQTANALAQRQHDEGGVVQDLADWDGRQAELIAD